MSHHHALIPGLPALTVLDVRDGAILLQVDIETVWLEVLGHHHARFDDAGFLGEVTLGKALETALLVCIRLLREAGMRK